ncbi:hypothetical protein ACBY43_001097 [Acinetobacter baumannii]|uniref:hypothetical protein n=1 Tax=Acinetobacter baumannii TaxID=470 RepID=UPI0002985ADF|nr:hypothetical protein [Acinetobacter baumannii]EKP67125.1 hypothetical protein ACIN5035_1470 [Acinetobacter baumannii OIFC035]MDC4849708.1 hypothetical protein [Acinetobacter baumannii]TPU59388.1 hypothetical protein FJV27_00525 [Acinetobacter baumannii]
MINENENLNLIIRFQQLTLSGEITWKVANPHPAIVKMKDEYISTCYYCSFRESDIYLYVERYSYYNGEFDNWLFSERTVLTILENDFISWENYTDQGLLNDLLRIVMNSTANIGKFF